MAYLCGIGCRYPGEVNSPQRLWEALLKEEVHITEWPKDRWFDHSGRYDPGVAMKGGRAGYAAKGKSSSNKGGFVKDFDVFDTEFFRMSPKEAAAIDPQQRWALEVAYEAIHDARLSPDKLSASSGMRTGVYAGAGMNEYYLLHHLRQPDHVNQFTVSGGSVGNVANRVSYVFDFSGPSLAIDTACSSGLTALWSAVLALNAKEIDAALVLGVNLMLDHGTFVGFSQAGMLSPTGTVRPFDESANGYVRSEGCGAVLLLREAPSHVGPRAYCRVLGCGANQDGKSETFLSPNEIAQATLVREVLDRANVDVNDVVYVEAHGTGTAKGDPTEAHSLAATFRSRSTPLPIGSIKGNLGHLEFGSGIAGLIKAALILHQKQLAPTAGFARVNPKIAPLVANGSLRIQADVSALPPRREPAALRCVGVNSFGFGGANAFALLQENAEREPELGTERESDQRTSPRDGVCWRVESQAIALPMASHSAAALAATEEAWRAHLSGLHSAADVAGAVALHVRTSEQLDFRFRTVLVGPPEKLQSGQSERFLGEIGRNSEQLRVGFVFGGQGSHTATMGRELYAMCPVFKSTIDRFDALFSGLGAGSLLDDLGLCGAVPMSEDLLASDVRKSLPAIVAVQAGLVNLLRSAGVSAAAVLGHSAGEMLAAYAGGFVSEEGLCALAWARAHAQHGLVAGAMTSLACARARAEALVHAAGCDASVAVAAENARDAVTLSGSVEGISACEKEAQAQGIAFKRLSVSRPYHSPFLDAQEAAFKRELGAATNLAPKMVTGAGCRLVSSALGGLAPTGCPLDAAFWWDTCRRPVSFLAARRALEDECDVMLEVDARPVLRPYVIQSARPSLSLLMPGRPELTAFLSAVAELYCQGAAIRWDAFLQAERLDRNLALPPPGWNHTVRHRSAVLDSRGDPGLDLWGGSPSVPFATRCLSLPLDSYLLQHVVNGRVILPGAFAVDLALQQARARAVGSSAKTDWPQGGYFLQGVKFERFLEWPAGEAELELRFEESARARGGVALMCGRVAHHRIGALGEFSRAWPAPLFASWSAATEACGAPIESVGAFYANQMEHSGLKLGPVFCLMDSLRLGRSSGVVAVEITPPSEEAPSSKSLVHPTVLDAAVQAMTSLLGVHKEPVVPVEMSLVLVAARGVPQGGRTFVAGVMTSARGAATWTFDFDMWAGAGTRQRVLAVRGMIVRLAPTAVPRDLALFKTVWQPCGFHMPPESLALPFPECAAKSIAHALRSGLVRILCTDLSLAQDLVPALDQASVDAADGATWHCVALGSGPSPHPNMVVLEESSRAAARLLRNSYSVVCSESPQIGARWAAPGGIICTPTNGCHVASQGSGPSRLLTTLSWALVGGSADLQEHLSASATAAFRPVASGDAVAASGVMLAASGVVHARSALAKCASLQAVVFLVDESQAHLLDPASLEGCARTLRGERPDLLVYVIHSELTSAAHLEAVWELLADLPPHEFEFRADSRTGRWLVPRLLPSKVPGTSKRGAAVRELPGEAYRVVVERPGDASSVGFQPSNARLKPLKEDEVRIQVAAIGLNFKDAMLTMGLLPGVAPILGKECSGHILEAGSQAHKALGRPSPQGLVGRPVVAHSLGDNTCLMGNIAICKASKTFLVPDSIDTPLVHLAGFPIVTLTAHYALVTTGGLRQDDVILVHSAAGGLGRAALQVAARVGARVIASAGTEAKRALVRALPSVIGVIDSRSPARFVEEVRALTHGRGVDVVLNSLGGEGLEQSLACLAPRGRFLEVGKQDMLAERPVNLGALLSNVSFHSVQLDLLDQTHPAIVRAHLQTCLEMLPRGEIATVPTETVPIAEAGESLRKMLRGEHTGKIVLEVAPGWRPERTADVIERPADVRGAFELFNPERTYLFTGSTRGIGFSAACWAIEAGARNVILTGRSRGRLTAHTRLALEHYREAYPDLELKLLCLDLEDEFAVKNLLATCHPPVAGVFHFATEYEAGPALANVTETGADDVTRSLGAKARGAWNLHGAAEGLNAPLDVFFLASSVAVLGVLERQSAYAAANTALEALARFRRSRGQPATALALPAVLGAGRLSEMEHLRELTLVKNRGPQCVSIHHVLHFLGVLLSDPGAYPPATILCGMDWAARSPVAGAWLLTDHLVTTALAGPAPKPGRAQNGHVAERELTIEGLLAKLARILGTDAEKIDRYVPLRDMGLDSLAAVELEQYFTAELGRDFPPRAVLDGLTPAQLLEMAAGADRDILSRAPAGNS